MDSGRGPTGNFCRKCCSCLVPVRCIIDQHEVEIIPASARSSTSNDYSVRGGSSFDSTSRTAYGSSSYRQHQHQQLSQRAAAVGSPRGTNVYPLNHGPASGAAPAEMASYRSAAASDLFSDNSRLSSWDSRAPRVPLINLRKIQHHGAALPFSPIGGKRAGAVQPSKLAFIVPDGVGEGQQSSISVEREEEAGVLSTQPDVPSAVHEDFERFSVDSSLPTSTCERKEWTPANALRGQDVKNVGSAKQVGDMNEQSEGIDIVCLERSASEARSQPSPGHWLASHFEVKPHVMASKARTAPPATRHNASYDLDYSGDGFPLLGMDIGFAERQEYCTPQVANMVSKPPTCSSEAADSSTASAGLRGALQSNDDAVDQASHPLYRSAAGS
ncbi:hypothetical protein Efla_005848 [Eimeria flavescens]